MAVSYTIFENATGRIVRCGITMPFLWRGQLDPSIEEGETSIDEETGQTLYDVSACTHEGLTIVPAPSNLETDYFDLAAGAVAPRPAVNAPDATMAADGVSAYRLEGLPAGTELRLDGTAYTIDDGVFEVVTDEAQLFLIEIAPPFPYLPSSVRVTAQ